MKATVGDRIVITSRRLDAPVREGEIIEVRGADGSPPYVVRWSEDGHTDHTDLIFPGPDARIIHQQAPHEPEGPSHGKRWHVDVIVDEHESGLTKAHIVADTGVRKLQSYGEAHRRPTDLDVAEIGDEVAVGRAFIAFGNHLLHAAAADIEEIEGRPVQVSPSPTGRTP
ncbi:DUF1918 domain-containing protein [Catenulispora subtropica]|uniref:DUF1918 domain-containing protein n=1 Tax=Catenulispora subtropica TaxID=450798 RepID=A0ABN2RNC0_9ACTN